LFNYFKKKTQVAQLTFAVSGFSYLTCEDEDDAEGILHVSEEDKHRDKELLPSCTGKSGRTGF
jgi:hypothetical protein